MMGVGGDFRRASMVCVCVCFFFFFWGGVFVASGLGVSAFGSTASHFQGICLHFASFLLVFRRHPNHTKPVDV